MRWIAWVILMILIGLFVKRGIVDYYRAVIGK